MIRSGLQFLESPGVCRMNVSRRTPPEFIAGTLPHMSPVQTGRMNRSIGSRSDLYSMGVVLYEMVTGTLPFVASDPVERVHARIARQPVRPHERSKDIPGPASGSVIR